LILVDFRDVNKTSYRESIVKRLLKFSTAYKVFFFILLFFRGNRLRKGFAIDFDHKLVAFYLALIILADKALFLAL
jgi:hypothetical protein